MKGRESLDEFKEQILYFHGYDMNQKRISKRKGTKRKKKASQLSPVDFLRFAQEDLRESSGKRSIVNCLTNCKRAIDCQIDELIRKLGYYPVSRKEKWFFPRKIQFIKDVGIVAPRIIEKVNKLRNDLEHEFKSPTIDKVEDALDIATLFVSYARTVNMPTLNVGIGGGIQVQYDFDEMSFHFFRELPRKHEGKEKLIDLEYEVKYGEPEFDELYDFLTRTIPHLHSSSG